MNEPTWLRTIPWTVGDALKALGALVVSAALGLAVGAFVGYLTAEPAVLRFALLTAALFAQVLLILAIWYFAIRRRGARWTDLGLRPPSRPNAFLMVWGVLGFSMVVQVVYVLGLQALGLDDWLPESPIDRLARDVPTLILLAFLAVIVAPLTEELFFRGFLFPALSQRFGVIAGMVLSGILFAFVHVDPRTLVPISLLGIALAWLYAWSGSLWPSIAVHALFNSLGVAAAVARLTSQGA